MGSNDHKLVRYPTENGSLILKQPKYNQIGGIIGILEGGVSVTGKMMRGFVPVATHQILRSFPEMDQLYALGITI